MEEVVAVEVLVVIHKAAREGVWSYDVLYKLSWKERRTLEKVKELAEKLNKRLRIVNVVVNPDPDIPEYRAAGCPYAEKYVRKGWEYLLSGDTDHIKDILREMGLSGPDDLEGLIRFVKEAFKPDKIIVEKD